MYLLGSTKAKSIAGTVTIFKGAGCITISPYYWFWNAIKYFSQKENKFTLNMNEPSFSTSSYAVAIIAIR